MGKKGKNKKQQESAGSDQQQPQQQQQHQPQQQQQHQPQQQQQHQPQQQQQQQQRQPQQQQQQQQPQQQQRQPQQQQQRQPQQQQQQQPQQQQRQPQQQQQRQPQQQQQQQPQQQQQRQPQQQQQRQPQQQQQQQPQQQQQRQPQQQQQRQPQQQQQQRQPQQQQQQRQPQQQQQRQPQQQQQQRQPQQQQQRQPQQQQQQHQPQQQQQRQPQQQQQQHQPQQQQQRQPQQQQQQRQPWQQQQQQRQPQQQQPQGPPAPQQQPQGPPAPQKQWGPPQSQQQVQGPPAPQQQQQGPPAPQQQSQGPPAPQKQWGPPRSQQQVQGPPAPQQQQQGPPAPQQQSQGPPAPQKQWGPPRSQQQVQGPPAPQQQQQQGPPAPQQQQKPPAPQQQQKPPAPQQQQRPPAAQQQQKPPAEPVQQEKQIATYGGGGRGSLGRLTLAMQNMYLDQIPKRMSPTGGTAGRRIEVETNMFKIDLSRFQSTVVHYDVIIDPDRPKFLMRPVFEEFRRKYFPNRFPAFDGKKNAYSANELPFGDESPIQEVQVFDVERQQQRTFKMHLKKAAVLDLSWLRNVKCGYTNLLYEQSSMQALDIILRHGAACNSVTVGRSLFQQPEPGRVVSLSNGLDLWVGVFQSAVIGWKPYLNVDVAHKGFPTPQSIIDLMKDLCKHPRDMAPLQNITPNHLTEDNMEKITKFIKGLKIQYEIPGQPNSKRTYRVNGLGMCPRRNEFTLDNGQVCTVEKYFAEQKKYKLQYPDLPCLCVGSQRRIHLPAELCMIVAGQVTQKKMDETQTSKMIKYAATSTDVRKKKIANGFANMRINDQPTLTKEFKLSVSHDFEKVPARVLQPPKLEYHGATQVNVMKGVWRAGKFLNPSCLADNEWTILNLDRFTQDQPLYHLENELQTVGRTINMQIGAALKPFTALTIQRRNWSNISEYFNSMKKKNLKLVVVIIPNMDNAYSAVKQMSELKTVGGIVTQVLKSQTLRKLSPATITNILLKINSKLNGINHRLARRPPCLERPCMLVGADVTHPSPDSTDTPSIAAVTASYNPSAFQYNIELRLQPPREEMILDLEAIMRNQLLFFYRNTKFKPERIIFYRDGVSEGQLTQVLHYELSAIKRAIQKLGGGGDSIPITFLVVQKRHHTRFFPTDSRNSDDRNYNVQAGTIVDTEITHPTQIDFYLVSHASIQGTARPTKYRCIANEIGMTEDEIEQLTYYLCHLFARCTRSVSYPAPTYYAHLAAFRARALIQGVHLNFDKLEEEQERNMKLQMQDSPMFFV